MYMYTQAIWTLLDISKVRQAYIHVGDA